jgi:hypothetical protein
MGLLEIVGVMWIVTQVFGDDVFMVCISGCM